MPHLTVLGAIILTRELLCLVCVCESARDCMLNCRSVLGNITSEVFPRRFELQTSFYEVGGAEAANLSASTARVAVIGITI